MDLFKEYKSYFEKQNDVQIKRLNSDNGTELCNEEFDEYLKFEGIAHSKTPPFGPQANGLKERYNLTLMNSVRNMLKESGLGHEYWPDAARQACRILNRVPKRVIGNKYSYEKLTGKAPWLDGTRFKIFCCLVFVRVPSEKRKKLDEKAVPSIYLGTEGGIQIKVKEPDNGSIYIVRHARFDETIFPGFSKTKSNKRIGWFAKAGDERKVAGQRF